MQLVAGFSLTGLNAAREPIKNGTEKRTRTSTGLPPLAPEASVSTNSTTSAIGG